MNSSVVLKVMGVLMVCVAIHYGLTLLLPLIVFGAGLLCIFLS